MWQGLMKKPISGLWMTISLKILSTILQYVDALGEWSPFFTLRFNVVNRPGLSPIQKCTATIKQLANGSPVDQLDE